MATQVQLRRGTAAENDAFTGAQGEVTVDTTNDTLRVHDGSQAGGYAVIGDKGGTIDSGNLSFGDNDKAIFGAGSDFEIYSDGINGVIKDTGTGRLRIYSDRVDFLNQAGDEIVAVFNESSDVQLRYANAQKLATTATGIDVTGTVTADGLTVDGGGTFSGGGSFEALELITSDNNRVYITGNSSVSGDMWRFGTSTSNPNLNIDALRPTSNILLRTAGSEAMRIDSSGNLLVGHTTAFTTGVNGATIGQEGANTFARDGGSTAATMTIVKRTNDGTIVNFNKDATKVGSIGTANSTTYIDGSGNFAGLQFGGDGATEGRLLPRRAGAFADGEVDLGDSDKRFKDLYLSGGVYLGGTGSANYLDDYEEGDFSPTVAGSSTVGTPTYTVQDGSYVKIGNLVTVQFEVAVSGWSSAPSGNLEIGNLPFATPSGNKFQAVGGIMTNNLNLSSPGVWVSMYKGSGSNYALLYSSNDDGAWVAQSAFNEAFQIISSITYRTA